MINRQRNLLAPNGQGGSDDKVSLADLADDQTIDLGGDLGVMTVAEMRQGQKGNRAITKGFQDLAAATKKADAAAEERDRRLASREDRTARALADIPGAIGDALKPAPEARPNAWETIDKAYGELDYVGDENISAKVQDLRRQEREATDARAEGRVNSIRNEMRGLLKDQKRDSDRKISENQGVQLARERNDRVFEDALTKEFPNLDVTPELKAEIKRKFHQHVGDEDYGKYDRQAKSWMWNDQAVIDSVWATDGAREQLIEDRSVPATAEGRKQGMLARLKGEEASNSTPGRSGRPSAVNKEDAFVEKIENIREALAKDTISPDEAKAMLSPEERQLYGKLRRDHMARRAQEMA